MTMLTSRAARLGLAVGATVALFGATAAPALALDPNANSSAFGLETIHPVLGLVSVSPQASITFPPGGTNNVLQVSLGALGGVGAVDTSAHGDTNAGTSSATSHIADVALLQPLGVPAFQGITASAVDASCSDNAPAAPTGSTTLTNAFLGSTQAIDISPAANDVLVNLPNLVRIVLNEQTTDSNGTLTVNAIHITLGTNGALGELVIGHVTCGPNTPAVAAFSFGETPFILGGIAVLLALVFGIRAGVRRMHAQA
jgi:hypothetical protein